MVKIKGGNRISKAGGKVLKKGSSSNTNGARLKKMATPNNYDTIKKKTSSHVGKKSSMFDGNFHKNTKDSDMPFSTAKGIGEKSTKRHAQVGRVSHPVDMRSPTHDRDHFLSPNSRPSYPK